MEAIIIILSVLFIFLILNTKAMGNKFDEVLEKLDELKAKVIADEAAESEALEAKKAEIAELNQQLADALANAGLSAEEEDAVIAEIQAKIANIEAEMKDVS